MTLFGFLILLAIAGIVGALGQAIAGFSRGGCLTSIAVGFIGALLGHTQPAFPRDAPCPTWSRSRTITSALRFASSWAQQRPITPPPMTATLTAGTLALGRIRP